MPRVTLEEGRVPNAARRAEKEKEEKERKEKEKKEKEKKEKEEKERMEKEKKEKEEKEKAEKEEEKAENEEEEEAENEKEKEEKAENEEEIDEEAENEMEKEEEAENEKEEKAENEEEEAENEMEKEEESENEMEKEEAENEEEKEEKAENEEDKEEEAENEEEKEEKAENEEEKEEEAENEKEEEAEKEKEEKTENENEKEEEAENKKEKAEKAEKEKKDEKKKKQEGGPEEDLPDAPDVLEVENVDLMSKQSGQNRREHHTDPYDGDELIVRRGQTFMMWLDLSRPFDPTTDKLHLELKTGAVPAVARGTHIIIALVDELQDDCWEAKLVKQEGNRVQLSVNSAPTAVIGAYRLSVVTSGLKAEVTSIHESGDYLYMLFNPWCEEDAVYMDEEEERQEYVLNDIGKLYYGTAKQIGDQTWNFGQFTEGMLDICLFILEKSGTPASGWDNPVNVVRVVSAMINSPDDGGVIEGNWSGDYSGGTSPTAWSGSVEILNNYYEGGGSPVRYGQCWVFSGVTTTVLRCLGIPTRSLTNFSSAHDTDVSLTIDVYLDEDLDPIEYLNDDSIWNFHVWNDCWMTRPDLPTGMGGWQAVDATPQETSQGTFCCGPASLAAVRSGQVYLPYDCPFVFAEVNSDKIYWQRNADGTFNQIHNEKRVVGHKISTKAVGSEECNDITHLYKHTEGSEEERITVETASQFGSNSETYTAPTAEDVSIKVTMDGEGPRMGSDASLTITLTNDSSEARSVFLHGQVAVMYYTGVHKATVSRDKAMLELKPNEEYIIHWGLPFKTYQDQLIDQAALMLTLSGRVSQTQQVLATQFNFRLRAPDLVIKPIDNAVVGKEMAVEISFTNPLPVMLKAATLRVEGLGLQKIHKIDVGNIGRYASFSRIEHFVPLRVGKRKLLASLDCKELTQVLGAVDILVEENNDMIT